MPKSMVHSNWGENSRRDLEGAPTDAVVLFPVGAVEQHGPHLPVDTDATIAEAIAEAVADQTENTLALPTLPYGYSPHHGNVPGTVSLSSETVASVVTDVLQSLVDDGFERIAILNGHGGNRSVLKTAVSDFQAEMDVSVAFLSYWDFITNEVEALRESGHGGVSHAGEMETSLILYLRDHLVRPNRPDYVRDEKEGYRRTDLFGSGTVYYPQHFDEMTETGVSGIPSVASADTGEQLFEQSVNALAEFVRNYRTW
jgi:creatinine amidohydrolase